MAKEMIDIGLDAGEDLSVVSGDFLCAESTAQHQRQLILNNKGDFKQNPTIGVGAFDYMNDENYQELMRAISIEFTRDGMDVQSVVLSQAGIVTTDAIYI